MGQKGATYLLYTGYPRTMVGRPLSLESVLDRFFSQRLYVVKKKLCGKKFRKKIFFFLFFYYNVFFLKLDFATKKTRAKFRFESGGRGV